MKVLELFAGSRSIGKAFEGKGHEVFSVDWDDSLSGINLCVDIMNLQSKDIIWRFGRPDVIWASPDCTTYSIAGIRHHRRKLDDGTIIPISDYASRCDFTNQHLLQLIAELNPRLWFIENPRGLLRKMPFMAHLPRHTVTYCQYGFTYMKPTDIWTNHPDPKFKPPCRNGDPCHFASPRGGLRWTDLVTTKKDRAVIPQKLCEHIVDICEEVIV